MQATFKGGNIRILEWMIVVGRRRFASGHCMIGGKEEGYNHGRTKGRAS